MSNDSLNKKSTGNQLKPDDSEDLCGLPEDDIFVKEMAQSDIDERELAYYLHDGKEAYERLMKLSKLYAMDPVVRFHFNDYDLDREEGFERMIQKLARLKEITHQNGMPPISYVDYEEYGPPQNALMTTSLHHGMFETVLRILGSEEQVEEYLPKVLSYEILG